MRGGPLRRWRWLHEWSSLACTLFLLILCATGLPLIFADEIEGTPDHAPAPVTASLDQIVVQHGTDPSFVRVASDEGRVYLGERRGGRPLLFDGRTGEPTNAGAAKPPGVVDILLALHGELLAGLLGRLFIAIVGLTALISIISGVVVYAPFASDRPFGDIRKSRGRPLAWLDRHNVAGIAIAAWLTVVAVTGFMNAIEKPLFTLWRAQIGGFLPKIAAGGKAIGPDQALSSARAAAPDMLFETVIFPGPAPGIAGYYLVWGEGTRPLTSRLTAPVAVNAANGAAVGNGALPMPWYLRALDVSRPLHFGDYGGLPLKMIWALLDLVAILVLGSGLYLWAARRRRRRSPDRVGLSDQTHMSEAAE
ncbi:PepSY-associated TM helix domain-containing protein [Sphingomonas panacis]|uniref:PepSY-associated TM helix domain-containing protein n=1 Tax=Sphingomonas panacis TaxID=1560345 RepID=UPI0008410DCE|nr:PepSY-associated TM helix domain-containing protein [Sphingomonas panacis]